MVMELLMMSKAMIPMTTAIVLKHRGKSKICSNYR